MVEIGQKVSHYIEAIGGKLTGTITWIHPDKRFYCAEFKSRNGSKFVEAFQMIPASRLASSVKDYDTKVMRVE